LKVNEKGTTAAAATEGVGGAGAEAPNPHTISITIDHPFLFLIRDSRTGTIVCGAEVEKP
jgi:serpin B